MKLKTVDLLCASLVLAQLISMEALGTNLSSTKSRIIMGSVKDASSSNLMTSINQLEVNLEAAKGTDAYHVAEDNTVDSPQDQQEHQNTLQAQNELQLAIQEIANELIKQAQKLEKNGASISGKALEAILDVSSMVRSSENFVAEGKDATHAKIHENFKRILRDLYKVRMAYYMNLSTDSSGDSKLIQDQIRRAEIATEKLAEDLQVHYDKVQERDAKSKG